MNTTQQVKYGRFLDVEAFSPGDNWRAGTSRRVISCKLCSWSRTWQRGQGRTNNALAVTARLNGEGMRHLREAHPDELS